MTRKRYLRTKSRKSVSRFRCDSARSSMRLYRTIYLLSQQLKQLTLRKLSMGKFFQSSKSLIKRYLPYLVGNIFFSKLWLRFVTLKNFYVSVTRILKLEK